MHDILRKYIDGYLPTPLTDEEFEPIEAAFTLKKLRKKQYLLQEGDVCKHMAFICKGALRFYSVDDKGVEHIIRFGIENWWITDRESFATGQPSLFNIDTIEDAELLVVTKEALDELHKQSPRYVELSRILEWRTFIAAQKRIQASISQGAEERYNDLQNSIPGFIQRFPQSMIASYLGVSPETLSRIRKQALSK
ncbi:MAG: Crp/Fnr family transcriptional regulator [Ferruginibacter sp.]